MTVSGTVVGETSHLANGADVMLNHDPARIVTTVADGKFEFADVTPPYTLTLKAGTTILEHPGLSGIHPQLSTEGIGARHVATLAGNIQSPVFPLPQGQLVLLGGTNGVISFGVATPAGAYDADFQWSGNSTQTVDIGALHVSVDVTNNRIISYWQTGKLPWVLLDSGMHKSGLDFALSAPVDTAHTVLAYAPGAYSVGPSGTYLMVDAGGARFSARQLAAKIPSGTDILLPSGGATLLVTGDDADGNTAGRIGTAVLGGTTTLDLPVNTLLKTSVPTKNATGVSTLPTLSWTPVPGANLYMVHLVGAGFESFTYLPGTSATLTIPDYTALGLSLQANTTYTWDVIAYESSSMSIDSVTNPATAAFLTVQTYEASSLSLYFSAGASFTTAP